MKDKTILLLDIDGLRFDVIHKALDENLVPNIARLLGEAAADGIRPMISTFPSITFCAQASLFTGVPPGQHGIVGNQFFDRHGDMKGKPRFFAFDVGDLLAFDDAVLVFTHGLASDCIQAPTMYETLAEEGYSSVVVGNMYAHGADEWLPPSVVDLARLTKGGSLLGLDPPDYDSTLLDKVLKYLKRHELPNILTYYLKGLDGTSHRFGTETQLNYLIEELDPHLGKLWDFIQSQFPEKLQDIYVLMFSDHGQIDITPDERHSIRMAFPYQNELAHLFEALNLDLHDYPGEDPDCGAVVAMNGGMAQIYLRNQQGKWQETPAFSRDVIPVAKALWEANKTGKYAPEIQGSIDSIFVRDTETGGWESPYQAFTPEGELISLEDWYANGRSQTAKYPVKRLGELSGKFSGDIVLVSNYDEGFYFAPVMRGVHGGLHEEDSTSFLAAGKPETDDSWHNQREALFSNLLHGKGELDLMDLPKAVNEIFGE